MCFDIICLGQELFLQMLRWSQMESLEARIQRVSREEISIEPYNSLWPKWFESERQHLVSCLPNELLQRIEHFGSTAVPGLAAKPIIDMLIGVSNLEATKKQIVPILERQGYEYFWRPTFGDDDPPWYAWFIKRDPSTGKRTHHLHMVESSFTEHWDRLLFRDHLIAHQEIAAEYERLKVLLAEQHPQDRVEYTKHKTEFVTRITRLAKQKATK